MNNNRFSIHINKLFGFHATIHTFPHTTCKNYSNIHDNIATAVMWGRSLYKNIQRFIVFQLTINVVALASVLLGAFFGTELPLTVTQMLWVNLIMDTFAAMALASIPPSGDVMNEKPRKTDDFIITKAMRKNILGVGFCFLTILMTLIVIIKQMPADLGK